MKKGIVFETFVKKLLLLAGFYEITSDGIYVIDVNSMQMIQGLGEMHNADVLLEPPIQIPIFCRTRLLVECKNYRNKVGLGTIRGALGLREDVNRFEVIEKNNLINRKNHTRKRVNQGNKALYQVAVASLNGFTIQAQNFAATHRIPLISFDSYPFTNKLRKIINTMNDKEIDSKQITDFVEGLRRRILIGVTNSGQLLLLYSLKDSFELDGDDYYFSYDKVDEPWHVHIGKNEFMFNMPKILFINWLNDSIEIIDRKNIIDYKQKEMSRMIFYYMENDQICIKMLSINKNSLNEAQKRLIKL